MHVHWYGQDWQKLNTDATVESTNCKKFPGFCFAVVPAFTVSELSGTFLAHSAVRAVLHHAFRGALAALEAAGFETHAIDKVVQLADASKAWGLERHAVLRDPCTENYVQLCACMSLDTPADWPGVARMHLQLHELDLPVPEYGEPKAVLVDLPLCEVLMDAPQPGLDQGQALAGLVSNFVGSEDPVRWEGEETRKRFQEAYEAVLQP